jgi:hypothetical protein
MIKFKTCILQFAQQGEKTGWSYISITGAQAQKLKKGNKRSFRVKGKLDGTAFEQLALIPMGDGTFIMALKAGIRKKIGKGKGQELIVEMEVDTAEFRVDAELEDCLSYEPRAKKYFYSLPKSHQRYFNTWILSAKTTETKAKRMALAVNALSKELGFGPMLRQQSEENKLLGRR